MPYISCGHLTDTGSEGKLLSYIEWSHHYILAYPEAVYGYGKDLFWPPVQSIRSVYTGGSCQSFWQSISLFCCLYSTILYHWTLLASWLEYWKKEAWHTIGPQKYCWICTTHKRTTWISKKWKHINSTQVKKQMSSSPSKHPHAPDHPTPTGSLYTYF